MERRIYITDEGILKKRIARAKRWNILIFCVLSAAFAVLVIAGCVFKYQHTYSRLKWDADRENRYKIVSNMLVRNSLIGISESEVIELLGDEDGSEQTSFKISREDFPPESTLVYYLGVDFIDINWLIISLENGIVTSCCIDVT